MRLRTQLAPHATPMAALLLALVAGGCSGEAPDQPTAPEILRHDFGVIPHGQIPQHEFVLDLPADLGPLVPLTYRGDCSCSRSQLILRHRDGSERLVPGYRQAKYAVGADEQLILRLAIDTSVKEPVDMEPVTSRGTVVLQDPAGARPPVTRYVLFTYGIDAPVRVEPHVHIAFPDLPRGRSVTLRRKLHSDVTEAIRFGPAHSSDRRVEPRLVPGDGFTLLEATFTSPLDDAPRPFSSTLTVETDLEGYVLEIPVSGRVLPDIQFSPMNKISLGQFDFQEPGADQFVLVTDHVRERDPGLHVVSLRDSDGNDARQHFAVHLEPVNGDPRTTRVRLEYTGGLTPPRFRGELTLAVDPVEGPFLPIEIVAFHRN